MAYDKVIDSAKLDTAMTATANAIRSKSGKTDNIVWDETSGFKSAVEAIEMGGGAKVVTGTVTTNNQNPNEGSRVIRLYDIGINPKMVMFYMPDMIPSTTRQYFVIAMIADTETEECIAIRRNKSTGEISSYLGAVYCEADGKTTNIWSGEDDGEEVHCYASTYNYIAFV